MTRKEEIEKIASAFAIDEVKDTCNPASKRGLLYAGFVSGAEWADEYPHWISVEDELPKGFAIITNGDDVLVGKYNFEKGDEIKGIPSEIILANFAKTCKNLKGGAE